MELRLASCGSRGYVAKIADILQQVLSCEHGGRVFVEHNAFKNDGTYASCKGVKSLAPFTGLRHTGRKHYWMGCCRLPSTQRSKYSQQTAHQR